MPETMNGWIDAKASPPLDEDRYLIVYQTERGTRRAYIGDYIASEGRWMSLPLNVEVVLWMPIPAWPSLSTGIAPAHN